MYHTNLMTGAFFGNRATPSSTSATMALNRLVTSVYQPRPYSDMPEWNPSQDEIIKPTVACRWGAVGSERFAQRDTKAGPQRSRAPFYGIPTPTWSPFNHSSYAQTFARPAVQEKPEPCAPFDRKKLREEMRLLNEFFNPINAAIGEAEEARLAVAKPAMPRRRCPREEMEELTESFNPFNPVNVAARAASEARLASGQPVYDSTGFLVVTIDGEIRLYDAGTSPPTESGMAIPSPTSPDQDTVEPHTPPPTPQKSGVALDSSPESYGRSGSTVSSRASTPDNSDYPHLSGDSVFAAHSPEVGLPRASAKPLPSVQASMREDLTMDGIEGARVTVL